ncbi:peptide ABC transporter substrate-binding protein [Liquorilactobacillus satsumensis]|uniref:peptide ABC transporter substrate-binding protein n=1 Tax=Liquorilactobacillus satsumensis TaxID=259059 RepID=UPI001E5D24BF|nr:peptide ABC transporter substrate-binding protein [Liquorilactobacillus satsumensis]MCC7667732.1 peptide ABC transporter substrate-binding protein [Liquorilactobacillus satsumensis]
MKFKKKIGIGLAVAFCSLALVACGKSSTGTSGTLAAKQVINWNENSELPTMDPSTATDTISFDMLNNTGEGLYRLGKDSKIEPGIAKATKVSNGGMTYTFTLRKNAKWSNGDKLTAKDFVYSWQRTVKPATGSQYAYLFSGIQNADDITAGKKPASSLGIKAEGDYKLVVTLDKKIPYFKLLMGFPSFFPQNQGAVEKYGSKYGTASKYMVYSGPFTMTKWTGSNLSWTLKKNNDYWDKKNVKLSQLNFQVNKSTTTSYNLYQSGKLDETLLGSEQAKQLSSSKEFTPRSEARINYLEFNQTQKNFQNKKIRQAISLAINRTQLVKKILADGSFAAPGIVSKGLASYNGEDFTKAAATSAGITANKTEAKKLWQEGLKELGVNKLSFTLLADDTDAAKNVSEYIQSQLEETLPNAQVSVSNVPFKTRLSKSENGDFEVVLSGWGADFSDPISFLDLFTSDNSYNNGKWKNAQYDKLIAASKAADAGSTSKRWKDMSAASKLLLQDQGVAPLYQQSQATLVKSKVKGVIYNSAGVNYNFKNAYVSK